MIGWPHAQRVSTVQAAQHRCAKHVLGSDCVADLMAYCWLVGFYGGILWWDSVFLQLRRHVLLQQGLPRKQEDCCTCFVCSHAPDLAWSASWQQISLLTALISAYIRHTAFVCTLLLVLGAFLPAAFDSCMLSFLWTHAFPLDVFCVPFSMSRC